MKKVLVVDDCLLAQEIISDGLTRAYTVKVFLASDTTEALACLDNNIIDFIICDYQMPGGNGLLVLDYLKKNSLSIPFILFSSRYDIKIPVVFPLIEFINDKSYNNLFDVIHRHGTLSEK